jgi:hypothetical protein
MIGFIQIAGGCISIVAGVFCIAVWMDYRNKLDLMTGFFLIAAGLILLIKLPKIETKAPPYSSEWIDEETKCHWYGGKIVNCESVRYMGEL